MINELKKKVYDILDESKMIKSKAVIIDEQDLSKITNTENMPSAGITFSPTGISDTGMVEVEMTVMLLNVSSDNEDDICSTVDYNTTVAKMVYNSLDCLDSFRIETSIVRGADENNNIAIATVCVMKVLV